MILVIAPLVQVATTWRSKLLWRIPLYALAAIATAALFAAAVAQIARAVPHAQPGAFFGLAVLAFGYGLHELGGIRLPLPSSPFRVPRSWLHAGNAGSPLLYGAAMGPGFLTATPFASYHAWLILLVIAGDGWLALTTGVLFGLLRAGSTVLGAVGSRGGERGDKGIATRAGRVLGWAPGLHVLNGLGLIFVAGSLLTMAVSGGT